MTIGSIGACRASYLSQMLPTLLNRLTSTSSTSSTTASATAFTTSTSPAADTALTGSSKAQLSDQILNLLTMMQAGSSANGTTSATGSTTASDPLSSLVSAIDSDGDGSISQSEMESYIEGLGGTQSQADALFNGLNQNGSGNLTTATLQSDLQSAGAAHHAHGHHHHHHHAGSANDLASQLMQASDTNNDGSISQSEFENFVTSLGGTTAEADSDFSALDSQGGSGITSSQLSNAISTFQKNQAASNPILGLLDGISSAVSGQTTSSTIASA